MSTAERSAQLASSGRPDLDLDDLARMSPEGRAALNLPDHMDLPDHDETFVQNFQEHPQTIILTTSIKPMLDRLHPDGRYLIGQDCGIYWRVTDPPLRGCKCPDWFYVPGVDPAPSEAYWRSYVLWQQWVAPLILLEIVSGDGSEERDRTPYQGKFWVYENVIRPRYYGIFEAGLDRIEMYHRVGDRFERLEANHRGRYPIEGMGVELGLRHANDYGMDLPWMRWWDPDGNLILTGNEAAQVESDRAAREADRADRETDRANRETDRAERLSAQLRALGIEPDA